MSAEAPRGAQSSGAASPAPRDPGHRAPWAVRPEASRGRLHPEPSDARSPFGRDRDRIIPPRAFRRLQYKTQVFVFHEGDSFRTRLTHSIEVAQIARSLARRLRLDEDLAEAQAAALADDIAYNNHDLDDGIRAGLFSLEEAAALPLVAEAHAEERKAHGNLELERLAAET